MKGMILVQGMTDLVRKQNMERGIRRQEFVPCRKLNEKAKSSERYIVMETFPLIKSW